jgi:hypothetical protein
MPVQTDNFLFRNLQSYPYFDNINVLLQAWIVCGRIENQFARVVERLMASGCKPDGVISYVGSNPTPCTSFLEMRE